MFPEKALCEKESAKCMVLVCLMCQRDCEPGVKRITEQ